MKKLVLAMTVLLGTITAAHAGIESCASKRASLERELHIAQSMNNPWKVQRIKQALMNVDMHCSDSRVKADAQKKIARLEQKVREKQYDIKQIQYDLANAKRKGDVKKVMKYERKLSEKKYDLSKAQNELKAARKAAGAL